MNEWNGFVKEHPEYTVTFYNSQTDTTNKIIASTCYPRNTHRTLIIAPKWSPLCHSSDVIQKLLSFRVKILH